jgi:ubiquinone/menaquinone biosynthesis C-methylase UbiE
MKKTGSKIPVSEYYEKFAEAERLQKGLGRLEFDRTRDILSRFLPRPLGTVLDVGGGMGPYSVWLAGLGYRVHLVEPSPNLIAKARELAASRSGAPLFQCHQGDARSLDFPDNFADAALLLGPLYHLTGRKERFRALSEARRVLKRGGTLFCAAISRFASAIDGLARGFIDEPLFFEIVEQDLASGQHRNPTDNLEYFTDAFFHRPSDLKIEVEGGGFVSCQVLPVEGLGVFLGDPDTIWAHEDLRLRVLEIIGRTERDESILGVSPHLLAVARKPE